MDPKEANSNATETNPTVLASPVFNPKTMAFTVKQLIELNDGFALPLKDGIRIVDGLFMDIRARKPRGMEMPFVSPEETYCVKIPEGFTASGATLLLSREGAITCMRKCQLNQPLITLAQELAKRAKWDKECRWVKDSLAPYLGKYDPQSPFKPWASTKDIGKTDIAAIKPFPGGELDAETLEHFAADRPEFEKAFLDYARNKNPELMSDFLDCFSDFADDWRKSGKQVPRLKDFNVAARKFGQGNDYRFLFCLSWHFDTIEEAHLENHYALCGRHDAYKFWLWCRLEDERAKKEAELLDSYGRNKVVATNLEELFTRVPDAPLADKGDRRRKHFEDRKQPRTGRNGKRWSGKGGHGFEIKDSDDN